MGKLLTLPTCGADGCETVSTRGQYHLVIDGKDKGLIRLCWECEFEFGVADHVAKKMGIGLSIFAKNESEEA